MTALTVTRRRFGSSATTRRCASLRSCALAGLTTRTTFPQSPFTFTAIYACAAFEKNTRYRLSAVLVNKAVPKRRSVQRAGRADSARRPSALLLGTDTDKRGRPLTGTSSQAPLKLFVVHSLHFHSAFFFSYPGCYSKIASA